jgi:hypothetical protein
MAFTIPYKQHNYMGEFANVAGALGFIQAVGFDSVGDGSGTAQAGMLYYNTTSNSMLAYNGTAWVELGVSDHGALSGLADDDHTQYILVVATPSSGTDAANKAYVDALVSGLSWQNPVLDKDLTAPPGSPTLGDRYIVGASATGDWATHDEKIAEYNGSGWDFSVPSEGFACWVEDEDLFYVYNNANDWAVFSSVVNHNTLAGLQGGTSNEYYHLTSAEHTEITAFFAATDISGAEAETLTDGSDASTLHIHDDRYFTETELGSTTASSEGASLIGTDTKTNLNNATDVEAALTHLESLNPQANLSGTGSPNLSGGTAGNIGDRYIDTTYDILWFNTDGTATGWATA